MPCYVKHLPAGPLFICGESLDWVYCATEGCQDTDDFLCDYPVGEGKTCDRPMCEAHANEIGPDLHYCTGHLAMWQAYKDSGGLSRDLENVTPFKRPTT